MAGSYNHCVTDKGKLRNPRGLAGMVETPGDMWEAAEEMYGMIWFLADYIARHEEDLGHDASTTAQWVERARQSYMEGIRASPGEQKVTY
jgi:hypothetical protein